MKMPIRFRHRQPACVYLRRRLAFGLLESFCPAFSHPIPQHKTLKSLRLLALLTGLVLPAAAQIPGKSVATYTSPRTGRVYQKGDTLTFALGQAPDGSFRYAYLPPNQWLGTPRKPLTATWNNLRPVIKDLRQQRLAAGMGTRTVAVIAAPGINACVELESAEESGELRAPR